MIASCTCALGQRTVKDGESARNNHVFAIFRALTVTSQVATPGAESAVCDCLVVVVVRKISMSDASPMRLAF